MSRLDRPGGSCPPQDQSNAAKCQYPPPPRETCEHLGTYHQSASSDGSAILPSGSYDSQFLQPDGHSHNSRLNLEGSYGNTQQPLSDWRRDGPVSWNGIQHMSLTQSAPRQRAAIACSYCRRRKIRCSGFGDNAQSRCTNCQHFQQECIFKSASGQVQAFLPAFLVYSHMQQLYGAQQQPLHQMTSTNTAVPSGELCGSFVDQSKESRKRRREESHSSKMALPIPGDLHHHQDGVRRPAAEDCLYLPPSTLATGPSLRHKPYCSPDSCISSNAGLPNYLPSVSWSSTPPPKSSPSERGHPTEPIGVESQASEIDKNMLGRLDPRKRYQKFAG